MPVSALGVDAAEVGFVNIVPCYPIPYDNAEYSCQLSVHIECRAQFMVASQTATPWPRGRLPTSAVMNISLDHVFPSSPAAV
jgi:hypothetical protein